MSEPRDDGNESRVVCHVCGKEVPQSTARSAEGRDYSYFFCGGGCELRWSANQRVNHEAQKHR